MLNHYYKPTPAKWRKIGDSILVTGVFITSGGLMAFDTLQKIFTTTELKTVIAIALIMGVLGKFITNFFKDDTTEVK